MKVREAAALIRQQITMEQVSGVYLPTEPIRRGFVRCPFHGERTASMKLYDDSYHCFGCHAHGDAVDFVGKLLHLSPMEAARRINQDFVLGLPLNDGQAMSMREHLEMARRSRKAINERERINAQRDAQRKAYADAADECAKWEVQLRDNAPIDRDAPFPAAWVEAAQHIDYARYVLENTDLPAR